MQRTPLYWIIVALVLLAIPLMAIAAPQYATTNRNFNLSSTAPFQKFDVPLSEPGCILAQIKSWSAPITGTRAATQLTLTLAISRSITQTAGSATSLVPLWTSLASTSSVRMGLTAGAITVTMPALRNSSANGILWVEYPPTQVPCEFIARPAAIRGRVDLSWRYTGQSFRGSFLVQRSTDGRTWSLVNACTRSASSTTYTCSDTGLTSARIYYYRACAALSGMTCGSTAVTPPLAVQAH